MKRILNVILAVLVFTFLSSVSKGQSEIEYEPGTDINVTTGADICADVVTINGTFSGDGTQCNSALPVELSSFSAIVKGDEVELNWQTATEVNNYGFEVERQILNQVQNDNWEKIDFVAGHGNSNSPKDYSFIDQEKVAERSRSYRLKQIDIDGKYEYSKEIEIDLGMPNEFSLSQNYPNPFNPSTTISYSIPKVSFVSLKIYDILGREVKTLINSEQNAGVYNVRWNGDNIYGNKVSSGIYLYKIEAGDFSLTKKMLLLK